MLLQFYKHIIPQVFYIKCIYTYIYAYVKIYTTTVFKLLRTIYSLSRGKAGSLGRYEENTRPLNSGIYLKSQY